MMAPKTIVQLQTHVPQEHTRATLYGQRSSQPLPRRTITNQHFPLHLLLLLLLPRTRNHALLPAPAHAQLCSLRSRAAPTTTRQSISPPLHPTTIPMTLGIGFSRKYSERKTRSLRSCALLLAILLSLQWEVTVLIWLMLCLYSFTASGPSSVA